MKTVSKSHNDDSNCSCESCLYRSESDRPSLRNLLARGSRIDRLYYGKYIPLREKKLLDRLVRTRAVYDDIRAQLLSDSTASLSTKANFVPKKKLSVKQLWSTERSGTILKVVGMVDKGEMLSSKNLSDCCSCCSCSSKIHIHNRSVRMQRHKHPYPGVQRRDNQLYERYGDAYSRKKGVRFKAKHIRSDPCTCTFKFSGLLKNHSKTMLRKLRTDAPLLVDLQATTDEEISQKRHRTADLARASYQILKQSQERVSDAMVEGIKKLNESKTKIRESLELAAKKSLDKLKQGKDKLKSKGKAELEKNNKNAISNKNVARICECPEIDLVSQIKKDSVIKFKDDLKKKRMLKDWECEPECVATTCDPEECYIKLKQKRPHTKITKMGTHREKREKKIGVPISQSNIKIQADKKKIKPILRAQQTEEIKSRVQFQTKNVQENDGKNKKHLQKCACEEKSKENVKPPKKSPPKISPPKKKVVNTEKAKVNQPIKNQIALKREAKLTNVHSASKRSSRQTVRIGSSFSFNIEFYKNRAEPIEKTYKLPARPTLAVKYSNYESKSKRHLYKRHNRSSQSLSKAKKKNKQIGRHKLKRCFCTLKLKGRKSRLKVKKRVTEETMTTDRSVMSLNSFHASCRPYDCIKNGCNSLECKKTALKNIQTDTYHSKANKRQHLLPYECEPGICTPDYCDPHRCIKLINIRNAKVKKRSVKCSCCPSTIHSRKTKSTSSLTSRSYAPPKAKYAQSVIAYTRKPKNIREPIMQRPNYQRQLITTSIDSRQAVRIGSTFSFNIEFYKNKSPYFIPTKNLRSLAIKPKPKEVINHKKKLKTRGYQKSLGSIYVTKPTQMTKKDRKANIGPALKRCFCTLKLQEKKHTKVKKRKMLTAGTETTNNSYFDIIMSNRSTKMDQKDVRLLEPFECEPFVCIPGECDPYVCLERIKTRHKKLKNAGISTKQPLIAVGSSAMYSEISSKTIQAHSKPKAKHQKTLTKPKKTTESIRKMKLKDKTPKNITGKNSVNIGSSFSFNIEFSKSRSPMTFTQSEKWPERKSKMTSKNNAIDKKIKINAHVVNENTQVERSKYHHKASMMSPLLKRCFCTLNLQKKRKQHSFKKDSSNSIKQNLLPPRIYTINAMTEEIRNRSYLKIFNNSILNSNQLCVVKSNYEYKTKECSPIVDKSIFISKNREYIKEKIKPLNNLSLLGFTEICSKLGTDISLLKTSYENNSNKLIMNDNRNEIRNISNGNINEYKEQKKISLLHPKQRQTNHVAHYFKNCFNIMNLQIENNYYHFPVKRSKTVDILKNNKTIKLLPYECEPGICTPGECNPYECQKLILKRTMKNKSTKSGTKNRTESISSNTRVLGNKSTQNNKKICMKKFTPENYKDLSDYGKNRVVRIGSSFNFNVEFFKNKKISRNYYEEDTSVTKLSSNVKARKLKKQTSKSLKSIGTTKDHKYHNMQSQSQLASVTHRASTTLPMLKRCICTLKLHKKGRLHKGTNLQQLKFPYDQNIIKIHTNTRGQNTKKTKPLKTTHRLEPYECEPNICDPGNCDPYHCLEIMKSKIPYNKTKESSTERKLYKNKSIHSMTKKNQSKATQRKLPYSIIPTDKIRPKLTTDVIKPNSLSPTKQVVRVGSSFSFNIEFFKDRSPYRNEPILSNEKGFVEHKKYLKDIKQKHVAKKHSAASTVQTTKNKKSQMQNIPQIASTMTSSFVKRCFCTAKLYQNKEKYIGINLRKNAKPSFFKKCLCWLKLKKSLNTVNKDREINKKKHFDKKTMTRNNMHSNMRIGRYECEPGICVPGECDPYECDAICIKRLKKHSQSSATPFIHSHSIHSYGPINITKNAKTQSILGKNIKNVKKSPLIKTSSDRTEKQLVRIGSNFSFNIEFYKNNMPKHEDLTSQPVLRKPWHNRTKAKASKIKKDIISVHSRHSQAMLPRKNDHSVGINYMKRCFCTSQFNNKSKETTSAKITKAKIKSIMTENSKLSPMILLPYECEPNICIPNKCDPNQCDKIIQTHKERYQYKLPMQAKLLPYECEPLTCVPGQCNPIECLERIKKRQNESKHFGTTIDAHNRYTASTMTKVNIKPKNKRNQSKVSHRMTASYKIPTDKLYAPNFHKQAVKIGSTFNFDLEFYKDNVSGSKSYHISDSKSYGKKKNNATLQTISKSPKIKKNDQHTSLLFINSKIQVPHVKQKEKKPVVRPFLKKCFCIFKLHNIETRRSPIVHQTQLTDQKYERRMNNNKYTVTERKKILPFECGPNVCVPGLCDPYECEKRIKRKSRNVSSLVVRQNSDKYTGIKAEKNKRKNQKNYINKLNDFSNQDDIEDRKRIVEVPRFANVFDKKAVKIGSNFSFHIEFYKHTLPQSRKMTFTNDYKKIDHVKKNSTSTKPFNLNNRSSQAKIVRLKDKGLEAENILKRCFCTLKLQNTNSRPLKTNIKKWDQTPYYPQVVEVRRVSIPQKPKVVSQQIYYPVKAKATQSKNKYKNENISTQCICSFCQHCGDNNPNKMHTIYPYVPKKFNKMSSKTLISNQNIPINQRLKPTVRNKRLAKKKSQRIINFTKGPNQELPGKPVTSKIKKFLCQCVSLLTPNKDDVSYKRKNSDSEKSNIKQDKKYLDPVKVPKIDIHSRENYAKKNIPKKSKSLKLIRKNNNSICSKECPYFLTSKKVLQQVGDDDPKLSLKVKKKINLVQIPKKASKHVPTNNNQGERTYYKCNSSVEHYKKNLESIKFPKSNLPSAEKYEKTKLSKKPRSFKLNNIYKNTSCKKKCPYFLARQEGDYDPKSSLKAKSKRKIPKTTSKLSKHMIMKKNKDEKKHDVYCKCSKMNKNTLCSHCQNKMQQEINQSKSLSPQLKVHFLDPLVLSQTNVGDKNKKIKTQMKSNKNRSKKNIKNLNCCRSCGRIINAGEIQKAAGDFDEINKKKREIFKFNKNTKPLFEMQLDSDDYDILNKDEIIDNVSDLGDHRIKDQSKYEAHTNYGENQYASIFKVSQNRGKLNPCICGSMICAKENKKLSNKSPMSGQRKRRSWKKCVCGSPVCDRESGIIKTISPEKISCICKKEKMKITKKKEKQESKLHAVRMKQHRKEDQIRRRQRQKADKEMAKRINKNASDVILLAESAIDIGKLGITACMDILRALARMGSDPKHAYRNLKAMKADPKLIGRNLKIAFDDSGVAGTVKRIRLRCLALRGVKKIKTTLESYQLTNYLLHIAAKDPKKRMLKKKRSPRLRERLDFGCSLYMASLRKRPFISVYDRVPWFYPHFLSLLNMYKQFRDILLFLLAVVVWSPCILCMEACRAVMCCFFCTG